MSKLKRLKRLSTTSSPTKKPLRKKVDTTPNPEPLSNFTKENPAPTLKTSLSIKGPWPNTKFALPDWNTGCTVVGLDPSLNGFGICQLNERFQVTRSETWAEFSKLRGHERVSAIAERIKHLCINLKGTREVYFVREDYAYSQSDSSDSPLKELGGVIRYIIEQLGCTLYVLPIQSIKKFVSGKGNSKKEEMMRDALKNFGFEGDQNQVDALGVALLAMCLIRRNRVEGLNARQKEALDALIAKDDPLASFA